ncbi:hypothetical protein MG293_017071 [Ovis ammon polii]|uniref:Uncharacterized protein n=1 Tax=Ovis ammon polii TaxID=230172 RepID=A0AAD4Y2X9_OVIAM|nr:hypothetical protein MG293_017071 [Ovis ammon polii]
MDRPAGPRAAAVKPGSLATSRRAAPADAAGAGTHPVHGKGLFVPASPSSSLLDAQPTGTHPSDFSQKVIAYLSPELGFILPLHYLTAPDYKFQAGKNPHTLLLPSVLWHHNRHTAGTQKLLIA